MWKRLATGTAERGAAKTMVYHTIGKRGTTLGTYKGYDVAELVEAMRKVNVPTHVAQKDKGSVIDGRTTRHEGSTTRLKTRKRIEEVFGWGTTVGSLDKTKFKSLERDSAQMIPSRFQRTI